MKRFINKILGRNAQTGEFTTEKDVASVLERVDRQIGRAVTRLGDR